jgi:OOP family OmpA-OmpF porin
VTLVGVHFQTNSAKLTADSSAELDPLAANLKGHPRMRVEMQGHTDSTGSPAHNLKLSQARAESVRDYLVDHGVPPQVLTAKGYGETQPVADNKTPQGRAQNRRVVMVVLENPADVPVKQEPDNK